MAVDPQGLWDWTDPLCLPICMIWLRINKRPQRNNKGYERTDNEQTPAKSGHDSDFIIQSLRDKILFFPNPRNFILHPADG